MGINQSFREARFYEQDVRVDRATPTITYTGYAEPGTADSTAGWKIKRETIISNSTSTTWLGAGEYQYVWNDRYSLFGDIISFSNVYSLDFDGLNDYVSFGNVFSTFDTSTQWSMSFWVKVNNYAAQRCVYSKVDTSGNVYGFSIQITTGGKIFLQTRVPGGLQGHTGNITVPTNTWFHLVVTYTGANNLTGFRIYVDDVVDTTPISASLPASFHGHTGQIAMFGLRGLTAFPFVGNIDEVTFWDKALSAAEVTELYNAGVPFAPQAHSASANLLHYWPMGDGDGYPTILDNIDNIDGTMTNMVAGDIEEDVP